MRNWIETKHCLGGVHCRLCRDREGGRAWRQRILLLFNVPDNNVDWPCPQKKEWDYIGPSRGLRDTVAKAIKFVTRGRLKPCRGCKKRQAALNRLKPYRTIAL